MPKLTVDGQSVEVPPGSTLLQAAGRLGIAIPTMCYLEGLRPATSCMVCLVKVRGNGDTADRLLPACAAPAEEGMRIDTSSPDVTEARRTALELLLSDHAGDCIAPCQRTCPAHMNIPRMIRQIGAGLLEEAIVTVKRDIALPAVLGRICPELCEARCRRAQHDAPLSICLLKRYVADVDLTREMPYQPACKPSSGKRVAIVGAGPAGLSAAYYLAQEGHACTLFDDHAELGGMLRYGVDAHQLPHDVLDAEIGTIVRLGLTLRLGVKVGHDVSLDELRKDHEAVILATGPVGRGLRDLLGLPLSQDRLPIDPHTHCTDVAGVFAAGGVTHGALRLAVRSVADGKNSARAVTLHLKGQTVMGHARPFTTRMGPLGADELRGLVGQSGACGRTAASTERGMSDDEARTEVSRCMRCDCMKADACRLRRYAEAYGAGLTRYVGARRRVERHIRHADIVYEPGKCIVCGLCVEITRQAGETLGLTFVGRGFDVRVDVPFEGPFAEALTRVAARCAEACPTGALWLKGQT